MDLPPGFRFHPTDEELVAYYLRRKISGRSIEFDVISEIDLYKQEPWDLPEKSHMPGTDWEWYFFSPRDRKYPNGLRTNRATEAGYWKATGKDRSVKKAGKAMGMKKTLVFYRGRAPHGARTDWVMHEYRLDEEECEKVQASESLFVLCRVFKKSKVGPRSNDDRGPQTFVDDLDEIVPHKSIEKGMSGSFTDCVKKASEAEPKIVEPLAGDRVAGASLGLQGDESRVALDVPSEEGLKIDAASFAFTNLPEDVLWLEDFLPALAHDDVGLANAGEGDLNWVADQEPEAPLGEWTDADDYLLPPAEDSGLMGWQRETGILDADDFLLPALVEERENGSSRFGNLSDASSLQARRTSKSRLSRSQLPVDIHERGSHHQQELRNTHLGGYSAPEVPQSRGHELVEVPGSFPEDLPGMTSGSDTLEPELEDDAFIFHDSALDFDVDGRLIEILENSSNSDNQQNGYSSSEDGSRKASAGSDESRMDSSTHKAESSQDSDVSAETLPGWLKVLDSLHIRPASAAECPDSKSVQQMFEKSLTYSAVHVSAVTVTCTSSSNGEKHVQAAVADCHLPSGDTDKGHQLSWKPISVTKEGRSHSGEMSKVRCADCDQTVASGGLQRKVIRGSNSGFVFVFVLGAVSALCWFLLLKGLWRVASHVFTSVF